jgi:putative transposase
VLGLWFQRTEGAKFWLHVLTDIKTRGVHDILFVCVDGLTGFVEAIEATFPAATVQTCVVHQVRSRMRFVSYKDRKTVAADLRRIYTAVDADQAADELASFAQKWDGRYPTISQSWLERWEQITPFLAYPQEVRRVIYTTNSIEALHRQLRKIIKTRGHFPTEDAARKLIYLAITKAETRWRQVFHWQSALAAFKIQFAERIPDSEI